MKSIEQTKLTFKKRKGVAPFIKQFPNYIQRVESQLIATGADESGLGVRENVDAAYNKIANKIFETLKVIANMGGDEEDKGQLTYHVVIIGEYPLCRVDKLVLSYFLSRKHALFHFRYG